MHNNCNCGRDGGHSHHHKPEINYPCRWEYRIIGPDEQELRRGAAAVMAGREHDISLANVSKTGKYLSLALCVTVLNESDRNVIFAALAAHPAVKHVL